MKESKAENEAVDMISNLPDPILQLILSGLPTTEEAVRTSVLSTRWRFLWTSVPSLDLDCTQILINSKRNEFKEFVRRVLVDQTLDLESFRLCCENHYDMSTVRLWIHAAVMRKVKLLDLSFSPRVDDEVIRLPNLVTSDTLEVLRLFLYKRRLSLPTVTCFPALRVLQLNSVELWDDDSVHQFLKRCPLLQDLSLINCALHSLDDLYISSPSLKTLRIQNTGLIGGPDGLQICCPKICCPKLVLLEYADHAATVFSIENLESLKKAVIYPDAMAHTGLSFETFAYSMCQLFVGFSHVESLSLNLVFIQAISAAASDPNGDFPVSLPNLKTLEISTTIDDYAMNVVIQILKCCPNLQSCHLIIEEEIFQPQVWELDEVLARHLKQVEFLEFNAEKRKVDMARFLLEHGNELEEMVFSWRDKVNYHEKSTEIMKEVLKFYKASSTVKLITLLKD